MISMSERRRALPGVPSQAEADGAPRAVAAVPSRLSIFLVPDRTRRREGGHIVLEGTAQRLLRPQPGEGQVQDRLAHLPPQTLTLVRQAEPRPRLDGSDGAEVLGLDALHAHGLAVHEGRRR